MSKQHGKWTGRALFDGSYDQLDCVLKWPLVFLQRLNTSDWWWDRNTATRRKAGELWKFPEESS
jgi:hypothetical protein